MQSFRTPLDSPDGLSLVLFDTRMMQEVLLFQKIRLTSIFLWEETDQPLTWTTQLSVRNYAVLSGYNSFVLSNLMADVSFGDL
jgi:hypothetical protein